MEFFAEINGEDFYILNKYADEDGLGIFSCVSNKGRNYIGIRVEIPFSAYDYLLTEIDGESVFDSSDSLENSLLDGKSQMFVCMDSANNELFWVGTYVNKEMLHTICPIIDRFMESEV